MVSDEKRNSVDGRYSSVIGHRQGMPVIYSRNMKQWLIGLFLCFLGASSVKAEEAERFYQRVYEVTVCDDVDGNFPHFNEAICRRQKLHEVNPQGRRIWLSASVDIPQEVIERGAVLGVSLGAMASSNLYWNGMRLGSNGVPGLEASGETPGKLDAAFFLPLGGAHVGKNQLALHMSSFHNPVEVVQPFHYLQVTEMRPREAPLAFYYLPALLTVGAFVLAALYFGVLGTVDVESRNAIFIAAMALFAGLQIFAETIRAFWSYDYPWQIWRLMLVATCAAGFSISMTAYVARRFQSHNWWFFVGTAVAFALLATTVMDGFDGKTLLALFAPLCVVFGLALNAYKRAEKGAGILAAAVFAFLFAIVFDGQDFLDRTFFFFAASLVAVLLVDQAREMRGIRAAKERMKGRATQLELELIRRRIAPHFLMNTLNALAEWVESAPNVGVKMIDALAEEFRLLSQMSDKPFVPLADEIALCQHHLQVMSYRVDRAFTLVTNDIEGATPVPPGILHTLMENAFTHGRYADGAAFSINQSRLEGHIVLTFIVPPPSEAGASKVDGNGEGCAYVRRRIEEAFGASATLEDGRNDDGGWTSVLTFEGASP